MDYLRIDYIVQIYQKQYSLIRHVCGLRHWQLLHCNNLYDNGEGACAGGAEGRGQEVHPAGHLPHGHRGLRGPAHLHAAPGAAGEGRAVPLAALAQGPLRDGAGTS